MRNRSATTVTRRRAAALLGVLLLSAGSVAAQTISLKGDLIADWLAMKETMMKISQAMPDDKYSFKATPVERTFAEQILHVADGNRIGMGMLGTKVAPPVINMKAVARADVLKALSDSYDFGEAVLRELTDQALLEPVRTLPFLGNSTRARTVIFELGHAWDIYGQMAVYLRLNGVVPPASQRP